MSRAIVGVAAVLVLLALTGSASADQGHAFTFRFSGPFAELLQINLSTTSEEITSVNVVSIPGEPLGLFIDQGITQLDANHNITGFTDTSAPLTSSGFSFDKTGMSGASLTASVPATACSYDAFDNLIGCNPTTMNASLTWNGQGPVQVGVQNDHFNGFGFNEVDHFDGVVRNAEVTGTVGDLTLTASDTPSADFGTLTQGTTAVCIGNSC